MRIPDAPVKELAEKAANALFYYEPAQMNWDVSRVTGGDSASGTTRHLASCFGIPRWDWGADFDSVTHRNEASIRSQHLPRVNPL